MEIVRSKHVENGKGGSFVIKDASLLHCRLLEEAPKQGLRGPSWVQIQGHFASSFPTLTIVLVLLSQYKQ